jgi:uncharacterized membrane protein YdcZ (DUF606 family)
MRKYDEAPWWWYAILLVLSFLAGTFNCASICIFTDRIHGLALGLIVVFKGQTTLPWWSYIVALILGAFVTVSFAFPTYALMCMHARVHVLIYEFIP